MAKLLSSLPAGAKVKDIGTTYNSKTIVWNIMEHGHTGDPAGTTGLVTEKIISLKCFDAMEASNSDSNRKTNGNNRYKFANLPQWLNSDAAAGEWYAAQHSADASPTNANVWSNYNEYDQEAGFLAGFSENMKAALQTVTKRVAKNTVTDGGGYEDVVQKIFLLSTTEVGLANENSIAEGSIYALFNTASNRIAYPTVEAVAKSEYTNTNLDASKPWHYYLRTPLSGNSYYARGVYSDGTLSNYNAYDGSSGVRPACVIPSSLYVSDEPDTDGAYIILWNSAPTITTTSENLGDKNTPFNFTYTITDADNDKVSATVKLDDETVQTLSEVVLGYEYNISMTAQTLNQIEAGSHTYTISAEDAYGNTSTKTVKFNKVASSVAISGEDGSIGTKWQPFEYKYQVTDVAGEAVTVKEFIDDELRRTVENVAQGTDITFDLTGFAELSNEENHTLTIEAINADGSEAFRTVTFKKIADKLVFETKPVETDAAAEKIMVEVDYAKTGNPEIKVEATNCAYNAEVIWENMTEAATTRQPYSFQNQTFDTERYGVAVRITITKNDSTERVYCYGVGVDFD